MDLQILNIEDLQKKIKLSADFPQNGITSKILEIEDKLFSSFAPSKKAFLEKDVIQILHSIMYWFPFDIRGNRDKLLYRSLQKKVL